LGAVSTQRSVNITCGGAGRLTNAWYVANERNDPPPSLGFVPPDARSATTDSLLTGVGVTGDAPGTNPAWLEPSRWNASTRASVRASAQWANIRYFTVYYFQILAPLLVIACVVLGAAARGARREA